jgi:hypothetical protein
MMSGIHFGQHLIAKSQVFYKGKTCLGIVNLMPVVPGNDLILITNDFKKGMFS